jgi:hypothetical protein
VLAAATDCSTNAVPDTNDVAVSIALYATVAATGDLTPAGTDPAFALKVFADDRTVTSGMAKLRFIHASPATPNVDVGVGTGASFSKLFANVAFGTAAAAAGSIDANGFLATTPLSGVNVTARLANASTDALTVPNVALPANAIATAFAIGGKTGTMMRARRLSFDVNDAIGGQGSLFLTWTMTYEPRRGPTLVFEGSTHARMQGGVIVEQRDYWDLLSSLAQSLPLLRGVYATLAPRLG